MHLIPPLTPAQQAFFESDVATPCVGVEIDVVRSRYRELAAALPGIELYYAVKANPLPEVVDALVAEGCRFDVASTGEVDLCLERGASASALSYGNTIKSSEAIRHSVDVGIDTFAFDTIEELEKLTKHAPGSLVMARLGSEGSGAAWPLSRKFGCTPERVTELLEAAGDAGHRLGVSFHVGSQQLVPESWDVPLAQVHDVARALEASGRRVELVNIGGGFPSHYTDPLPASDRYGHVILEAVDRHLGWLAPRLMAEPGRALVAEAGVLVSEVVLVSQKESTDALRWVYLDVGVFTGLIETIGETIRYPMITSRDGGPVGPCIVAGPTCDSLDVMAERTPVELPLDLAEGDRVALVTAGAYTTSYSSIGFNGFPPLQVQIL